MWEMKCRPAGGEGRKQVRWFPASISLKSLIDTVRIIESLSELALFLGSKAFVMDTASTLSPVRTPKKGMILSDTLGQHITPQLLQETSQQHLLIPRSHPVSN